mgnify:CR=1 FL=1
MTPLADQAAEYAAEKSAPGSTAEHFITRAFMFGALAALTSKQPREALLAECLQFGRAIGTAAEAAK